MDEWLLEIGYMNYAYGRGVSEWSLLIIPHKVAIVMAIGALIGVNFALIADQAPAAHVPAAAGPVDPLRAADQRRRARREPHLHHALLGHLPLRPDLGRQPRRSSASTSRPRSRSSRSGPTLSLAGVAMLVLSALLTIYENQSARSRPGEPNRIKEAAPC